MASSQVCEALAFINKDEGVREMEEVLEINGGALLMSLMDESSPSDESDIDERLDGLIRSFEAEIISGSKMEGHDDSSDSGSQQELMSNIEEDAESCSWNMGQDYWASSPSSDHGFGVEWVDMDLMPSSPFDYGSSWCVDPCGDEMGVVVVDNFNMVCEGVFHMEEHA